MPYITAKDPDSVGEAMPPTMPPTTINGMPSAGMAGSRLAIALRRSKRESLPQSRRRARNATPAISATASTIAGTMPAMNSAPTDSVVTEPRISMASEGGTVSDMAAEAQSTAANSRGRTARARMAPFITAPMAPCRRLSIR